MAVVLKQLFTKLGCIHVVLVVGEVNSIGSFCFIITISKLKGVKIFHKIAFFNFPNNFFF
jgi:hypothetical protein